MKKRYMILSALLAVVVVAPPWLLGFSIAHIGHATQVATSLSAKLACSAHFVTGLTKPQIVTDLSAYSPATELVELTYDDEAKTVAANLFGIAPVVAQYRAGKGCTLLIDRSSPLAEVKVPPIKINADAAWPLGSNTTSQKPAVQTTLENILLRDNEAGQQTRALVVVKDGQLVAEAYGPGITSQTPLLGWSMAKSVTAMMVATLEKTGLLKTQQIDLFPQWQDPARQNISVQSLLTMTSGLTFDETYAPGSDATHMLFTAPSASDIALQSPSSASVGEHFSYSSGTTNLLNRLIHNTLGKSADSDQLFLTQKLLDPASITSAVFETDNSGVLVGSSYLYASGRDWARLGLIMEQDGQINGNQILPRGWAKAARTPNHSDNEKAYGYHFWLNQGDEKLRWPQLPADAYAMMGNRKQSVMIIPSQRLVMVRLGWSSGDYPMAKNYKKIMDAAQN